MNVFSIYYHSRTPRERFWWSMKGFLTLTSRRTVGGGSRLDSFTGGVTKVLSLLMSGFSKTVLLYEAPVD